MFIWELIYFAFDSIVTGTLLEILTCDSLTYYITLLGWKIPNYILSTFIYLYVQGLVNKKYRKIRKSDYTITNFRNNIIRDITDALNMVIVNITLLLLSPILMYMGIVGTLISSYVNAMIVYEFRLNHIPTITGRLKYYRKDPIYMILFGYPLTWIMNSDQVTWLTIHHAYNLAFTFYIGIVWHIVL